MKPKCALCGNNHLPEEDHIWFTNDGCSDYEIFEGSEEAEEPEKRRKADSLDEAVGFTGVDLSPPVDEPRPEVTPGTAYETVKTWRERNAERHRAYMRDYMRRRRAMKQP